MKTGRDIAIALCWVQKNGALLRLHLIVEGCIMMRKCHLNTCPVGVATQDPELRKRFTGEADHVVNFFKFITQELREIMAELGFRTVNEMVGQVDNLEMQRKISNIGNTATGSVSDFIQRTSFALYRLYTNKKNRIMALNDVLDWKLLKAAKPALEKGQKVYAAFQNYQYRPNHWYHYYPMKFQKNIRQQGLPEDTIHFKFKGTAGQSFGAFNTNGVTLELEGDANDYFGKGLSGAQLIVYPSQEASFVPEENIIIGNVAFYGATSGEAYIRGKAGERFACAIPVPMP